MSDDRLANLEYRPNLMEFLMVVISEKMFGQDLLILACFRWHITNLLVIFSYSGSVAIGVILRKLMNIKRDHFTSTSTPSAFVAPPAGESKNSWGSSSRSPVPHKACVSLWPRKKPTDDSKLISSSVNTQTGEFNGCGNNSWFTSSLPCACKELMKHQQTDV